MSYKRVFLWIWAGMLLATAIQAMDWGGLATVKQMRDESRYAEAVAKLESMSAAAKDNGEQAKYLRDAIDIAVNQLNDVNRAQVLVEVIRDTDRRDFSRLQLLARFGKNDEALAIAKNIDKWPLDCRGTARRVLGDLHLAKAEKVAALECYAKAIATPGTPVIDQGAAARQSGNIYLSMGERGKAEALFRKALDISPAYYAWRNESMIALSQTLVQDKRAKEAVGLFETVDFGKLSGYWKARLLEAYAQALLADGKKIKAAETLDAALRSDIPKDCKARIEKTLDKLAEEM